MATAATPIWGGDHGAQPAASGQALLARTVLEESPQAYKMEWKSEVDMDSVQDPSPAAPQLPTVEGCPQTPGVLCQPLLSKGHFGSVRGDRTRVHEGIRPKPPPGWSEGPRNLEAGRVDLGVRSLNGNGQSRPGEAALG